MSGARPSTFTLTRPGPLRLYSTLELLRLPPPTWLVDGILPAGALVGLYGAPGSFKSFIALDVALAVASGRTWHGQTCERHHVIYVAAEGGTGMGKRAGAWLRHNHVAPGEADVAWLVESVPVNPDSDQMDILFNRVNDELDTAPGLVVIDTLARCFEGDENTQEDMGRFVAGVDRMRHEFGATVIVVHHTRLGGDRERGNTAFRGAADTMVFVERRNEDEVEIICNKQKDSEEFITRQLARKLIPEADSMVLVDTKANTEDLILECLNEPHPFAELKKISEERGLTISPATFKRRLVSLVKSGKIIKENGKYQLT